MIMFLQLFFVSKSLENVVQNQKRCATMNESRVY